MIEKVKKIYSYPAAEMRSLGTPEDLNTDLKNYGDVHL